MPIIRIYLKFPKNADLFSAETPACPLKDFPTAAPRILIIWLISIKVQFENKFNFRIVDLTPGTLNKILT